MMAKISFVLGGLVLAVLIVGLILLAGILTPKYDPIGVEHHTTCGEPKTMRAEGYNILGGTRYGRGPDDIGSDVPLANIDVCDPFVEVRDDGEERLWFWFQVEVIGQVFPYAAWGLPWEDLSRINPADSRNPTDPIWTPESIWGVPDSAHAGAIWAGREAHVCDDWDSSGLEQFFNADRGYTIPYGTTRAGWVCLTFSDETNTRPLPDAMTVTSRPGRARLTRWVDAWIRIRADAGFEDQVELPDIVAGPAGVCAHAEAVRPGSTLPDGPCNRSGA